jgi:ethanolaminephosphotransferase
MTSVRNTALPSVLLLVAANVLIPVALFCFGTGFFPYKPVLPGLAQYFPSECGGQPSEAPFDRLVFMVVDALRRYFDTSLVAYVETDN